MPTRCNRCFFYCRSYCLLNMFRSPLCLSSGAREYYTVVCRLWSLVLGFKVVGMVWSWGLFVRFASCCFTGYRMVPETFWASNKICNKKHLLHLVGILFPHINDDALSKSLQIVVKILVPLNVGNFVTIQILSLLTETFFYEELDANIFCSVPVGLDFFLPKEYFYYNFCHLPM
jgi:hypothetical protein